MTLWASSPDGVERAEGVPRPFPDSNGRGGTTQGHISAFEEIDSEARNYSESLQKL
jgi:hypothetical protein